MRINRVVWPGILVLASMAFIAIGAAYKSVLILFLGVMDFGYSVQFLSQRLREKTQGE